MIFRPRRWAIVCCLVAATALEGASALARDMPVGTKNFISPNGVPNYFSNESEPFIGRGPAPREPGHVPVAAAPRQAGTVRQAVRHRGRPAHGRAVYARGRSRPGVRHHQLRTAHSVRNRRPAAHIARRRHSAAHHDGSTRRVAHHRPSASPEVRPVAQR
jgi:hypothetical protein